MSKRAVAGTRPLAPYSPGIVAEGRFVFVSGQGPFRGESLVEGDVGEQTRQTLDNIGAVLEAAGSGFEHVVSCRVFLTDMDDFDAMNAVYAERFPEPRPARTTIGVATLPGGIGVEIDCVALVPEG